MSFREGRKERRMGKGLTERNKRGEKSTRKVSSEEFRDGQMAEWDSDLI